MVGKEMSRPTTYRFLALVPFRRHDGIVVFGNVQLQEMLVGEVPMAFGTAVHVGFLVVHVVLVERGEGERLVGGKRAPHDSGLVRNGRVGVQVHNLAMERLLADVRRAGVF